MVPESRSRFQRWTEVLLIVMFSTTIALPLLIISPTESASLIEQTELRRPAPFPKVEYYKNWAVNLPTLESLATLPRSFEPWWNDHLGLRRQFLRGYKLAKIYGLTTERVHSPAASNAPGCPVIIGKKGHLFYSGERLIEDFRHTSPFTQQELDRWKEVLEERRDWLASRGIRYVMFVCPNPQTIYPERMPKSMNRVREQSRLDQLVTFLRATSNIEFVDFRGALLKAKKQYPAYHKTDTHWNDFGAFIAYREIMKRLSGWYPQAQPRLLSDFNVEVSEIEGGALSQWLDAPVRFSELNVRLVPKHLRQARLASDGRTDYNPFAPTPLNGGEAGTVFVNPQAPLPKAVVLHDSYFCALAQYFNEHWQRAHYVWTPGFPSKVIAEDHPDVVFQEMVERLLMLLTPGNPPELVQEVALARAAERLRR